jgi:hypothetical protein
MNFLVLLTGLSTNGLRLADRVEKIVEAGEYSDVFSHFKHCRAYALS